MVADASGAVGVFLPADDMRRSATWRAGAGEMLLAVTPRGRVVVAGVNGTSVQVLSITDGKVLQTISGFVAIGGVAADGYAEGRS